MQQLPEYRMSRPCKYNNKTAGIVLHVSFWSLCLSLLIENIYKIFFKIFEQVFFCAGTKVKRQQQWLHNFKSAFPLGNFAMGVESLRLVSIVLPRFSRELKTYKAKRHRLALRRKQVIIFQLIVNIFQTFEIHLVFLLFIFGYGEWLCYSMFSIKYLSNAVPVLQNISVTNCVINLIC